MRHLPTAACEPFGIEIIHPDAFLRDLHERAPGLAHAALAEQAAALSRPPMTVDDVLDRLKENAPEFVSQLRDAQRDG